MGPLPSSTTSPGGRVSVAVDDLAEGMILAADVHDAQGRLLVPHGTALTERHLRAFRLWGVFSVGVRGQGDESDNALPPISPAALAEAEAYVGARFRNHDRQHPLIGALMATAVQRIARRLTGGGGPRG